MIDLETSVISTSTARQALCNLVLIQVHFKWLRIWLKKMLIDPLGVGDRDSSGYREDISLKAGAPRLRSLVPLPSFTVLLLREPMATEAEAYYVVLCCIMLYCPIEHTHN